MNRRRCLFASLLVILVLPSCSRSGPQPDPAALEASAAARIQAIPPANPEKYRNLADMRNWRNPYITIRTDGVGLLDADNHEVHLLKPEELPQALAKLPPSAWPYGRVVGVSVVAVQSPEEAVLIRKNRGIVAGTLESMKVTINWVPSA